MSAIPSTAKAWRYPPVYSTWKGIQSLELQDVPVPSPGKGEVLVKIRAVSLNQGDLMISRGEYKGGPAPTTGPDGKGLIPASDGAGDIVAIGEGVTGWRVGDRVHSLYVEAWVNGPFKPEYVKQVVGSGVQGVLTQYRIFPADFILPIPEHLSYEEASTIPCAGITAWTPFFEKRNVGPNSTVLVLGSGGVSVYAAQLAKAAGGRVIATTSSGEKADRYRALGVDQVVNYRENPEWFKKVREVTGGEGVDDVMEIGGPGTLIQSLKSIKQEGFVHTIGFLTDHKVQPKENINDLAQMLLFSQGTLSGSLMGHKEAAQRLDAFLSKHKLKPVIDSKVFAWDEVVEAHAYMDKGSHFGKVVIRVD